MKKLTCVLLLVGSSLSASPNDDLKSAAAARDPLALEAVLAKKPDINAPLDEYRQTALFIVLEGESTPEQNMLRCAKLLIASGADVNAKAYDRGSTVLHSLASPWKKLSDEHLEIVDALIAAGFDPSAATRDGETVLAAAIEKPKPALMKKLIDAGAELNPVLKNGQNYVHFVARLDREKKDIDKALELLIAAGVDFDTPDDRGRTPLHYIAEFGNEDALRAILKYKLRIDRKDNDGKTAIDLALRPKGIADNNSYEKKLAAMIRKAKGLPKLTEIGTIFAASERQVDITGPGIAKAKPGQKLLVRTSMGDYTLITENNMHTKLVAKSSPAAAARLKKGDKVFLK